jgi:hypothetical protein
VNAWIKKTKEVAKNKRLERLVLKVGKEYCEVIQNRVTMKDKKHKLLCFLRIGLGQGELAFPIPKHPFKK